MGWVAQRLQYRGDAAAQVSGKRLLHVAGCSGLRARASNQHNLVGQMIGRPASCSSGMSKKKKTGESEARTRRKLKEGSTTKGPEDRSWKARGTIVQGAGTPKGEEKKDEEKGDGGDAKERGGVDEEILKRKGASVRQREKKKEQSERDKARQVRNERR